MIWPCLVCRAAVANTACFMGAARPSGRLVLTALTAPTAPTAASVSASCAASARPEGPLLNTTPGPPVSSGQTPSPSVSKTDAPVPAGARPRFWYAPSPGQRRGGLRDPCLSTPAELRAALQPRPGTRARGAPAPQAVYFCIIGRGGVLIKKAPKPNMIGWGGRDSGPGGAGAESSPSRRCSEAERSCGTPPRCGNHHLPCSAFCSNVQAMWWSASWVPCVKPQLFVQR